MATGIDRYLADMAIRGAADRRNGTYRRWLMTELGEIELSVLRTRTWSALRVVWPTRSTDNSLGGTSLHW